MEDYKGGWRIWGLVTWDKEKFMEILPKLWRITREVGGYGALLHGIRRNSWRLAGFFEFKMLGRSPL